MSNKVKHLKKILEGVEVEWKKLWEVTTWDKRFNAVENYKQPKTIKYFHLLSNEIKPLIVKNGKQSYCNISKIYSRNRNNKF